MEPHKKGNGSGVVTSKSGSTTFVESYGQDHSDVHVKNTRRSDKFGGGTDYLGHSLKGGGSAKQDHD